MNLREVPTLDRTPNPGNSHRDRLTQLLVWAAFILVAALAAVAADLWLRPTPDGPVAQAAGPVISPTLLSASSEPTLLPPATVPSTPTPVAQHPATPIAPDRVTPPPCVPPVDWGIHIVQQGNTLYSLAQRYGTDVDTLMLVNCLNTFTIFIDQRLYVPGAAGALALPTSVPTDLPTSAPAPTSTPLPGASATPAVEITPLSTQPATPTPEAAFRVNIPNRYLNIVLLGSDRRPRSGAWRTDSMIIVSVDTQSETVRLLSLPRDLWVFIPGHGYNRINTADLWGELAKKGGGPERVKQTIHHNLGIPIHYYVRVDFRGFMNIIDTVGGLDIDVDCPLPDINLSAGMHHMDAKQALRYARSRKSTSDFDRGRRQRKVLMALWEQALTFDIIPKLPLLWRSMADSYQTDLPLEQAINLAYIGVQLKPQRILSRSIGPKLVDGWMTPQGAAVLRPRPDQIRTVLEAFYAPKEIADLDATEKIRVSIENGSNRRDAERLAAAALRWEGFKVVDTGIADRRDHAQTKIYVHSGDLAGGEEVAGYLRVPPTTVRDLTAVTEASNASAPVAIEIILGQDYNPCTR
jgi:LCP family protein required for cell wall assembly